MSEDPDESPFPGDSFPPEDPDPEEHPEEQEADFRNRFVTMTLLFEACLALVGLAFGAWSQTAWQPMIKFQSTIPLLIGLGGGLGLFLTHFVILYPGGESNPFYRYIFKPFKESLLTRIPSLHVEDMIFIAVLSGVGEEILFRGWLQTQFGIVVASVLFGLIHIWGKEGIGYGLYAIGMGFVLGYIFQYTGNLWAPTIAHAVNNFLGLLALEKDFMPGDL